MFSGTLFPEPVLGGVVDVELGGLVLARLGGDSTGGAQAIDFLVVTLDGGQLQPGDASEPVGALVTVGRGRGVCHALGLHIAVVGLVGDELEERHAGGCEFVVARDGVLLHVLVQVDSLVECDGGDGSEDGRSAHRVAGYVVEGCIGALQLGGVGRGAGGTSVVLGTAANGNVGEGEARGYGREGYGCWCAC